MALRALSCFTVFSLLCSQASAVVFSFDCNAAKGACDTHCFASHCGNIDWTNRGFHRDLFASSRQPKAGSKTTSATFRRRAIGCVNSNPCSGGASCDELPYASTYDGGLGCIPQGFPGNANDLFSRGVIHCVSGSDNSAHGALLNSFYRSQNIGDGDVFTVALENSNVATLCHSLDNGGNCPKEGLKPPLTDYFSTRTTPNSSYCPGRNPPSRFFTRSERIDHKERAATPRFAITDDGRRIRETIGQLKEGDSVWSMLENGTETTATVVSFE